MPSSGSPRCVSSRIASPCGRPGTRRCRSGATTRTSSGSRRSGTRSGIPKRSVSVYTGTVLYSICETSWYLFFLKQFECRPERVTYCKSASSLSHIFSSSLFLDPGGERRLPAPNLQHVQSRGPISRPSGASTPRQGSGYRQDGKHSRGGYQAALGR